jgi:hypothetical protein
MARPAGYALTLLVPGPWPREQAPSIAGFTAEWIPNDGRFVGALRFGAFPAERLSEIAACPGALLVEGRVDPCENPASLAELGRALSEAGALAVRVEQSKAAWAASDWADLAALDLFRALVVLLVGHDGAADGQVADPDGAPLVEAFCRYQLDDDPVLLTGQTFRTEADGPRHVLERWPDPRYPEGHACWNPFGVWHLLRGSDRQPAAPRHFIPSLAAQLLAAERKAGRPLTRAEVEALRDRAPSIVMEPRDARAMERVRGYADVDPGAVWEHWQVLRATLRK